MSKKHLDFYYHNILRQAIPWGSSQEYVCSISKLMRTLTFFPLDQGKLIVAGQNDDGSDIIYQTEEEIILNNAVVSELKTLFLSRNNYFEYNSRHKLVSGIFSKVHCADPAAVNAFNENNDVFSTLGEDQILITDQEKTMDNARVGFAIASPSLVLGKSERKFYSTFLLPQIQ